VSPFKMRPLGLVIEPDLDNPHEVEGLLNPAAARGPDGELYLLPRMVAKGNFSRIGIMRVLFDDGGDPCGVERLGVALEPEMDYELRPNGGGGCEDPRVTYVEPLKRYVMTYTAFGPRGPRIALAVSTDLFTWRRLGLATFTPFGGIEFNGVDNKDATGFPRAVPNPSGQLELAILHRPLFPGTAPDELVEADGDRDVDLHRESIWISYTPMELSGTDPHQLRHFTSHHRLAAPESPWESLKIGSGTPPVMTRHGWLIIYHGVSEVADPDDSGHRLSYRAGVMVLAAEHPSSCSTVLTGRSSFPRRMTGPGVRRPTSSSRPGSIDAPTSASRTATTSTTGSTTFASAWPASTSPRRSRARRSRTRRVRRRAQ